MTDNDRYLETRDAYAADGVAVLRGVVSPEWQDRLAAAIERDILQPGPYYHGYAVDDGAGRFHGNLRTAEHDPEFHAFCSQSPLPGIAGALFGADRVNLFYDQLFVKEPGTPNRTRWHNDQPYWAVRGWQVLSFWVALDRTTAENGRVEFVRGSHEWRRLFQPEVFGSGPKHGYERNPDYEQIPDIETDREAYDIVSWDLEPGDALAFHGLTVHGAGGNTAATARRRGYTVRYTGDDVRYDTRPGTNVPLRSERLRDGDRLELEPERFPVVWRLPSEAPV